MGTNVEDHDHTNADEPAGMEFKRRWYQYSLRTLLVLVTLFAVACSWFAVKMEQARRQREVVEAIRRSSGSVFYDYEKILYEDTIHKSGSPIWPSEPPSPAWLRSIVGIDFFHNVTTAFVFYDNGLDRLEDLPRLRALYLEGAGITDRSIDQLKRLPRLERLYLSDTKITDAAVNDLQNAIPNLKIER
jgi:hypothetical protein